MSWLSKAFKGVTKAVSSVVKPVERALRPTIKATISSIPFVGPTAMALGSGIVRATKGVVSTANSPVAPALVARPMPTRQQLTQLAMQTTGAKPMSQIQSAGMLQNINWQQLARVGGQLLQGVGTGGAGIVPGMGQLPLAGLAQAVGGRRMKVGKLTGNAIPSGFVEKMSKQGVIYLAKAGRRRGLTGRDLASFRRVARLIKQYAPIAHRVPSRRSR